MNGFSDGGNKNLVVNIDFKLTEENFKEVQKQESQFSLRK